MSLYEWILIFSCFIVIILSLEGLVKALFLEAKIPKLNKSTGESLSGEPPKVSVLIPARNEEGEIAACLESLLQNDYPDFEVLVYDDQSTDKTGEIVRKIAERDSRVGLVTGTDDPPRGWVGKPHALVKLVEKGKPQGDIFLFTDADTVHFPQGIRRAVSFLLKHKIDCLSLWPKQIAKTFWEKVIQGPLLIMLTINNNTYKSNRSKKAKDAMGYGPYIMIKREAYQAIGGHRAVYSSFLESIQIIKILRREGFKTFFAKGLEIYSVRMYQSRPGIVEGWSRIAYPTIGESKIILALTILYTIAVIYLPLLILILALISGEMLLIFFGVLQYLFILFAFGLAQKFIFGYPFHAAFNTLGGFYTILILARSAYLNLKGRPQTWKERDHVHLTSS